MLETPNLFKHSLIFLFILLYYYYYLRLFVN